MFVQPWHCDASKQPLYHVTQCCAYHEIVNRICRHAHRTGSERSHSKARTFGIWTRTFGIWIGPHMFHRNGFSWLATVARRPRKNVLHPHPRRGEIEPRTKKNIEKARTFGIWTRTFGYMNWPCMFHRNGFSWLATVARRPRKNVLHPHPRRGRKNVLHGKSSPGPKKKTSKSQYSCTQGDSSPGPKKKQSDLQYSRTSSEDVYEYYRPNHSKIMYSNTRREDVKQYCKPHPPRRDMNGQTPST